MANGEIAQPAATERFDVAGMIAEVAGEEVTLETLSEKEELSAEDLRGYLKADAEGISDDDLMTAWKGGSQPAADPGTPIVPPAGDVPAAWDRPWRFFKGDAAVDDVTKLSAKDLLEAAISYKAGGADQRRTLDELVRLAQRVPLDEQRIQGLIEQVNQHTRSGEELRGNLKQMETDRATWMWALQDPTGARFQKLQEAFLNSGPPQQHGAAPADEAAELNRAGEEFYRTSISPHLASLARTYSIDGAAPTPEVVQHLGAELDRYFRQLVDSEASAMRNPQYAAARLNQIITYDLPAALSQAGYRQVAPTQSGSAAPAPARPASPPTPEVAGLKAQLQNLQTELAKSKVRNAPGAGAGTPAGAGKGGPDFSKAKSYHDILDLMRSPDAQWDVE